MNFNELKISTRITVGFLAIIVIFSISSFVAIMKNKQLDTHATQALAVNLPTVRATSSILNGTNHALAALRGWMLLGKDKFKTERQAAWKDEINSAMADLEVLSNSWQDQENKAMLGELKQLLQVFADKQQQIEDIAQTDQENLSIFRDLKGLGIRLAIDDFGTGYSSLASLKHLEVDCLKIDKYFVDDISDDNDALSLVGFMIEMGRKFGYEIIAEGVESAEQLKTLKELGCKTAQGYLFSKPVCGEEISRIRNKMMAH